MKARHLKMAEDADKIADNIDEMLQRSEEDGITGTSPFAATLRKAAQATRKMAAQYRESAVKLA